MLFNFGDICKTSVYVIGKIFKTTFSLNDSKLFNTTIAHMVKNSHRNESFCTNDWFSKPFSEAFFMCPKIIFC